MIHNLHTEAKMEIDHCQLSHPIRALAKSLGEDVGKRILNRKSPYDHHCIT